MSETNIRVLEIDGDSYVTAESFNDYQTMMLTKIEKLQSDRDLLLETMKLYANKSSWEIYGYDADDYGNKATECLAKLEDKK